MAPAARVKNDRPWWVKQRRFVVPAMLQNKIRRLPEDEQRFYCFIVSKIVVTSKKRPTLFHPISRKYFKNFIGTGYRDYINQLRDWSVIEVNEQYVNDPVEGFCKSYRLHPNARRSAKVKICFKKAAVQPLRDKSVLTDDVCRFVFKNLKRLTVPAELLPQTNAIDDVATEDVAEQIFFNQFNLHYSPNVGRLYHSVVLMPKVGRRNLILKDHPALPLFEYDVKSCHPVLLLTLIQDPAERVKYTALLNGDIYSTIARERGITKAREDIKDDFLAFVNGSVQNYFNRYFQTHFPILTEYMMNHGSGMAWFGQTVEAGIMVDEVPRLLMGSGLVNNVPVQNQSNLSLTCGGNPDALLYIPMHDGWIGIERDELLIAQTVRGRFHEHTGYWITVTKTKLATGEKMDLAGC